MRSPERLAAIDAVIREYYVPKGAQYVGEMVGENRFYIRYRAHKLGLRVSESRRNEIRYRNLWGGRKGEKHETPQHNIAGGWGYK